jgi:hypothetical protein
MLKWVEKTAQVAFVRVVVSPLGPPEGDTQQGGPLHPLRVSAQPLAKGTEQLYPCLGPAVRCGVALLRAGSVSDDAR